MIKFLLGMLFALIGLSLIDNFLAICTNATQYICYKIAKRTYEIKKQMAAQGQQEQQSNPIGFQTSCVGFESEPAYQFEEEQ